MKTFGKTLLVAALAALSCASLDAQIDTIRVSELFSTHVMFPTDLVYLDVSNRSVIALKIVEQNKSMFGIKAREPFGQPASVTALESNGQMHTWIVVYEQHPSELIIDLRREKARTEAPAESRKGKGSKEDGVASNWKAGDAPLLQDVIVMPRKIWHLGVKDLGIEVSCENIFTYSDITYIVLSVTNKSGVSYDCPEASFVVEDRKTPKRRAKTERTIFPQSRYGTLTVAPGGTSKMAFSMEKMSLAKNLVLRIYLYEVGGQRDLVMTVPQHDINRAGSPDA